jgi:RNA polymerase sigma-B factor
MTPTLVSLFVARSVRQFWGSRGSLGGWGMGAASDMVAETSEGMLAKYASDHDPAVRERLILLNLGLVTRLARRYAWRGQELDDLVQVGAIGLMNAIDRYDPSHPGGLVAFAVPSILGEIRRYFRDKASTVRLPRRLWELRARRNAVADRLTQELLRTPTPADISAAMPDESRTDLDAVTAPTTALSLDAPDDQVGSLDGQTLEGLLSSEDAELSRSEDRAEVRRVATRLLPTERIVLHLRYYEGISQAEVGGRLGISQMQVSRWERRALEKLRHAIDG